MPQRHTRFTRIKKHKLSEYRGVEKSPEGWMTIIFKNRKKYVYGPFSSEEEAAKYYDEKALEYHKEKAVLNILKSPYPDKILKPKSVPMKNIMVPVKRIKFSVVTKNKICSKQKWCCNFCKNLLSDIFIVDHIIPLALGGLNEEYNLQALCPSCDRYKTSQLDFQVIKPLMKAQGGKITVENVFKIQEKHYHKMMCISPQEQPIPINDANKKLDVCINGIKITFNF